jgi:hypothetical protein
MPTKISEEIITTMFRVENQSSKKADGSSGIALG